MITHVLKYETMVTPEVASVCVRVYEKREYTLRTAAACGHIAYTSIQHYTRRRYHFVHDGWRMEMRSLGRFTRVFFAY